MQSYCTFSATSAAYRALCKQEDLKQETSSLIAHEFSGEVYGTSNMNLI
jgi:hypothetical protein